jgi:hypothetical protein
MATRQPIIQISQFYQPCKCELAVTSNDTEERNKILEQFNFIAPGIKLLKQENTYILGCPLYDTGLSKALEIRTSELDNMTTRMCHLPSP